MEDLSEFSQSWKLILASFIGVSFGVVSLYFYSLGIFIKPLSAEFGWSRADASLGAVIGTICSAIMVIPVGWLVDRFGSKRVIYISFILYGLAFFLLGFFTTNLTTYLIFTALLCLLTAGATPLPFTRLVIIAFEKNRGKALGIILTGTGTGAFLAPLFLAPYIASHGWRQGYMALGIIVLISIPVIWLLLKGSKDTEIKKEKMNISSFKLINRFTFYHLCLIFFLAAFAIIGTVTHFFPMLTDNGLTPRQAGEVASLIGISIIVGRLITGVLLDRFVAAYITAALFLIVSLGYMMFGFEGIVFAKLAAVITGLGIGTEIDLIAFLVSRLFIKQVYGLCYGIVYSTFLIGASLGPYVAGVLYDTYGSYHIWLYLAASLLLASSLLSTFIPSKNTAQEMEIKTI